MTSTDRSRPLRVGIVGYGYASATFHVPLLRCVPGLELAAIASRDPGKVRAALPGVRVEDSPEGLMARRDLDLIVIPTPNETHYALASRALASGKHVVVDKPFTVTAAEARALKDQAERAGLVLSVFHNRRWDAGFLTLERVLREGTLGRIVHFESHFDRYRPGVRDRWRERPGPGAGLWYDLGPHLLDQALRLFGPPDAIALDLAVQRKDAEVDDWFHAVLRYGSMRAILHAGALVPEPAPRFTVHGERGTFRKRGLDPQEDRMKQGAWRDGADPVSAELVLWEGSVRTESSLPCLPGNYPAYYERLREAILGGGENPVTADDAIAVMDLLEQGLRSRA